MKYALGSAPRSSNARATATALSFAAASGRSGSRRVSLPSRPLGTGLEGLPLTRLEQTATIRATQKLVGSSWKRLTLPRGSVCKARGSHLTCPTITNLSNASGWFTRSTSAAFRRGPKGPIHRVIPRAFRQVAFASWTILCPLKSWASLAVGLLAGARLQRGYHVLHQ